MMNFEPPDYTKDVSLPNRTSHMQQARGGNPNSKFQSPLLQTPIQKFEKKPPTTLQNNIYIPSKNTNSSGAVYNRLGHRNSYRPNNVNVNVQQDQMEDRNFNRKRPADLNNAGSMPPRRKWRSNKRPFYQNSQNNNQNVNSVQDRINRIRSINSQGQEQVVQSSDTPEPRPEPPPLDLNESQDFDATDITVEVINHNAQPREDLNLARFKMVLDSKTQAAIKVIQQKRKDKQVIFPFPVTPNVTEISLHERFSLL